MKRLLTIIRQKELKPMFSAVFVTCCVLFLAHQLTQRVLDVRIGFADNYLDNFLATPILLTLLLVERRMLFRFGSNYRLSTVEIILATAFIAAAGELLFPKLSPEFTSDWVDVVFYSLGSVLFAVTLNKS